MPIEERIEPSLTANASLSLVVGKVAVRRVRCITLYGRPIWLTPVKNAPAGRGGRGGAAGSRP